MSDALAVTCPSCGQLAEYPDCIVCGHDFTAQPEPAPSALDAAADALLAKDEPRPPRHTRWKLERLSLDQPAPTSWLVRRYLTRHSLACIFGASGSGKSFLAVDLACAVATGRSWNGAKVSPGPVVYLAGEGHAGLRKRFLAWSLHHGVDLAGADIHLSNGAIALDASEPFETVRASLFAALGERRPALIVVDTAARHMTPGADENSGVAMGPLIDACDDLVRETGATCVVIHHTGHAAPDRERGWSGLRAALDWSYSVQSGNGGPLIVQCRKAKDHEPPDPLQLRLQAVELPWLDDEGEAERSAVLVPTTAEAAQAGAQARDALLAGEDAERVLDAIQRAHDAGVNVSTSRTGNYSAKHCLATFNLPRELVAGKAERFWRALDLLLAERRVLVEEYVNDWRKPRQRIVPAASAKCAASVPPYPPALAQAQGAPVRQSGSARYRRATGALAQPVKPPKPAWAAE